MTQSHTHRHTTPQETGTCTHISWRTGRNTLTVRWGSPQHVQRSTSWEMCRPALRVGASVACCDAVCRSEFDACSRSVLARALVWVRVRRWPLLVVRNLFRYLNGPATRAADVAFTCRTCSRYLGHPIVSRQGRVGGMQRHGVPSVQKLAGCSAGLSSQRECCAQCGSIESRRLAVILELLPQDRNDMYGKTASRRPRDVGREFGG